MPGASHWIDLKCPQCKWSHVHGPEEIVERLQSAGLLRRNSDATPEELIELLRAVAGRLACPDCAHQGLLTKVFTEDEDEWPEARCCEVCNRPIPAERLEAIPNATRCAACQSGIERGTAPAEVEYCRRCGSPMTLRQTRSAGITRYVMACTAPGCRG